MASRLKDEINVNKSNDTEDLLVFGYSCKLFRDDEKALYIDQGKHLIPWMADESLKIDRYDARGTLFDLKQAEAPSGGFDRFFGLTDMEKQVETMCDEERYRALVTNEEEETMYQEEEIKRLHFAINDKKNSYGQVEYKYDGESNNVEESNAEKNVEKPDDGGDDEPFVPSAQLDLPVNMIIPETVKHNAIIEKTAMFINNQGPQMEILLKMKQAANPQFNFLSFDNPLHNYYRHLLMAIKSGRYKPDLENANKKGPSIPSINYKPSEHCAYSMLVNKIKDKKSNGQNFHSSNLKEAFERLKDGKKGETNEENNQSPNTLTFLTPPNDMQIIIDKMASYVAKNGRDFETVVQMKNDPRFDFLHANHDYNPYYQFKVKQYEEIEKSSKPETKVKLDNPNQKSKDDHMKSKLAPVCFSIKKPKDCEPVIEKSALPVEESSDEEGKDEKKENNFGEEKEKEGKEEIVTIDLAAQEEKEEKNKKILAAERLKDKLTAAAREKVAMATKEKQLQLDRKRRAAAFLRTIHSDSKTKGPVIYGPQLPGEEGFDLDTEDGSDIASLPDTFDSTSEDRNIKLKNLSHLKLKSFKHESEKHKRHRSSNLLSRHQDKHRGRSEKSEKNLDEDLKIKEINERISVGSSLSSEEEEKRKMIYTDKLKRSDDQWKSKSDKSRKIRKEEKRHKKKT